MRVQSAFCGSGQHQPLAASHVWAKGGHQLKSTCVKRVATTSHHGPTRLAGSRVSRVNTDVKMATGMEQVETVTSLCSVLVSATESGAPAWLPFAQVMTGPVLILFNLAMLVRIPLSWYPKVEAQPPWIFLVALTEPLLRGTRKVVPPQGGVDVSPIIWLGLGLFLNEILNGPQGLLVLLAQK